MFRVSLSLWCLTGAEMTRAEEPFKDFDKYATAALKDWNVPAMAVAVVRSTPRTGDSSRSESRSRPSFRWPSTPGRMSRLLTGGWSSNNRTTPCRCSWVPTPARNSFIGPGSVFVPPSCFASLRIGSCHLIPTAAALRE